MAAITYLPLHVKSVPSPPNTCAHISLCAGAPQDGETYNETVYFIAGIDEESNQTISEFLQTELTAGANPAVGLSLVHVILHQLLGAIDVYR